MAAGKSRNMMKQRNETSVKTKYLIPEILVGICMCVAIFLFLYLRGYQPSGEDIYGHLHKAQFLGDQIREGILFPLYGTDWYNGYQPFRYWPILCYYVMAFLYLLTGNILYTYYIFLAAVFGLGYLGFCLIANREKRYFFIVIGIAYFFFPDNIRLMLGEGNLARVFLMGILPIFFYFYTNLIEQKKSLFPVVLMVFFFTNVHVMLAAMCAIFFSIYGMIAGWKKGTWYLGPLAFVLGFLCSGIVLLPALLGDVVGGSGASTANDVADWSQSLLLSLSFTKRMQSETAGTFGFLILILGLLILRYGKRKKGTIVALFFFLLTSELFLPVVGKLPFWMLRYVQMCYVLICYEWGFLEFKKKGILWLTLFLVIFDVIPSKDMLLQKAECIVEDSLLEDAVEHTTSRLGVVDESEFKSYISYYAYDKGVSYVQGWGLQGAKTRNRIVCMTEAAKYGYYSYTFSQLLELGCDSVLLRKSILPESYDLQEIKESAEIYGYAYEQETDVSLLFLQKEGKGTFGVNLSGDNLAIGSASHYISYPYPSFMAGESNALEDYTLEELKQYDKIYLSGFTYENQDDFEHLLQELTATGTEIYIDAADIPEGVFGIGRLMDIETQSISLKKTESWHLGKETYDIQLPYDWTGKYLTSSDPRVEIETFEKDGQELGYFASLGRIHVVGMSLPYMLAESHQEELQSMVEGIFGMEREDQQLSYEIVPLEITYEKQGMTITAPKDVCTNVAYQDNFSIDRKVGTKGQLMTVEKGTTHISYEYAYFKEGMIVSLTGIAATLLIWYLLFKRQWDPLVMLRKITGKLLEII